MQEYYLPFALLVSLVVAGLLTKRFSLWDKLMTNGSNLETWFEKSRFRIFVLPAFAAAALVFLFYSVGQLVLITQVFAHAFLFFIVVNFIYRMSGRHQYRLGVSLAFMFTLYGSIASLILFYMGDRLPL